MQLRAEQIMGMRALWGDRDTISWIEEFRERYGNNSDVIGSTPN